MMDPGAGLEGVDPELDTVLAEPLVLEMGPLAGKVFVVQVGPGLPLAAGEPGVQVACLAPQAGRGDDSGGEDDVRVGISRPRVIGAMDRDDRADTMVDVLRLCPGTRETATVLRRDLLGQRQYDVLSDLRILLEPGKPCLPVNGRFAALGGDAEPGRIVELEGSAGGKEDVARVKVGTVLREIESSACEQIVAVLAAGVV